MKRRDLIKNIGLASMAPMWVPQFDHAAVKEFTYSPVPFSDLPTTSRKITGIVCGAGNRGNVYGNYALDYPGELDIVGVAEPIDVRRERFSTQHKIPEKHQYVTWEHVFEQPKFADVVIITTPDDLHYGPAMQALELGYDLLLEKPIAQSWRECEDILNQQKKYKRIVAVCHVLRYAPYFQKIKEVIDSGHFGRLISVQHFEPIEHTHMAHSYVRGNWRREDETNPIILAKSCHDMDILRWWIGRSCTRIQSFGNLTWFREENAPAGSTARCTDGCAIERKCPYSAIRIYYDRRERNHVFDLPRDPDKQPEAVMHNLKNGPYGRCVYRCDNDVMDHQICAMQFKDDITVTFNMEAFTHYEGRKTRIMGALGDLYGDETVMYIGNFETREVEKWNVHDHTDLDSGHGGGDWRLVRDFLRSVEARDASLLTSSLDASMESHLMCFKAEESRKAMQVKKVHL